MIRNRIACFTVRLLIIASCCFTTRGSSQDRTDKTLGEIHGKITVTGKDELSEEIMHGRMMNRYGSAQAANQHIEEYRLGDKAVVYIDSVGGPATFPPTAPHPQLNQRDLIFRPLVLPVVAGSTVDFPNNDNVFHNVFSYSQKKEFDLGRYAQGKSKSVTFESPGVINVYCEIHQYMYATILVLQNPYFALPGDDGSFVIRDVPPGTYRISLWYGKKKVETKNVTIQANEVSAVNFSF